MVLWVAEAGGPLNDLMEALTLRIGAECEGPRRRSPRRPLPLAGSRSPLGPME